MHSPPLKFCCLENIAFGRFDLFSLNFISSQWQNRRTLCIYWTIALMIGYSYSARLWWVCIVTVQGSPFIWKWSCICTNKRSSQSKVQGYISFTWKKLRKQIICLIIYILVSCFFIFFFNSKKYSWPFSWGIRMVDLEWRFMDQVVLLVERPSWWFRTNWCGF